MSVVQALSSARAYWDTAAETYWRDFTATLIGEKLRGQVWEKPGVPANGQPAGTELRNRHRWVAPRGERDARAGLRHLRPNDRDGAPICRRAKLQNRSRFQGTGDRTTCNACFRRTF